MSKKECDNCFTLVDEDVDLCEACEEDEREMEAEDLEDCSSCGDACLASELNAFGECIDCRNFDEDDLDEDDLDEEFELVDEDEEDE